MADPSNYFCDPSKTKPEIYNAFIGGTQALTDWCKTASSDDLKHAQEQLYPHHCPFHAIIKREIDWRHNKVAAGMSKEQQEIDERRHESEIAEYREANRLSGEANKTSHKMMLWTSASVLVTILALAVAAYQTYQADSLHEQLHQLESKVNALESSYDKQAESNTLQPMTKQKIEAQAGEK